MRGTERHAGRRPGSHRFIPAGAGNSTHLKSVRRWLPVHPRGCGEQSRCDWPGAARSGSSPRVRGTAVSSTDHAGNDRFIPAGAGNRTNTSDKTRCVPVHPRGCGEQNARAAVAKRDRGSSPRVRGTGARSLPRRARPRFIPAGAGNSATRCVSLIRFSVHPRGCGEQTIGALDAVLGAGSSPRVRGTGHQRTQPGHVDRFIPAGAGNRDRQPCRRVAGSVHPRGCGEQGD